MQWCEQMHHSANVAPGNLSALDFYVIRDPLAEKVEELFPLPASVRFLSVDQGKQHLPFERLVDLATPAVVEVCCRGEVSRNEDQVYIPLILNQESKLIINLFGADRQLLSKMGHDWLADFQAGLLQHLTGIRLVHSDPETGLYNSRAAHLFHDSQGLGKGGTFYLIHVVSKSRSLLMQRQRFKHIAGFLQAVTGEALFAFGGGIFGLLSNHASRDKALRYAHSLQNRLKREGLRKVQIGFCRNETGEYATKQTSRSSLEVTWQALAVAEQRGPFGISDTATVLAGDMQPFALPRKDILKRLRKQWKGVGRFGVAICVLEGGENWPASTDMLYTYFSGSTAFYGGNIDNAAYILFPNCSADILKQEVECWVKKLDTRFGAKTVSIGVGFWPCLSYSKTDTLRNARKALMHGAFYGTGEVVFFDHLSLNVSGDYLFEEGDHRAAARDFRCALHLQPENINLLNSLGVTLIELNQQRKAIQCFESVLRLDPGNYMALVNLGLLWQSGNNKAAALAFFDKARLSKSTDGKPYPELYQPLGRLYCELGLFQDGVEILEEYFAKESGEKEFTMHRLLATAYYGNDQPQQAVVACQRTLQLYPQDAFCLSLLGLLYVETGQGEEIGLSLCKKGLSLEESNPDHWCRLGSLLLRTGEVTAALEAVSHCLELQPKHIDGLLLMAGLRERMGQRKAAARLYSRVLRKSVANQAQVKSAQDKLEMLGFGNESV